MSRYMVDAASPPATAAELKAVGAATGADVLAVYVPGWGTPLVEKFTNPAAAAKAALSIGWGLVVILDPDHDALPALGRAAVAAMRVAWAYALGFLAVVGADPSKPGAVAFDIEASDYTADAALALELSGNFLAGAPAGAVACQYGSATFLSMVATLPVAKRCEYIWCGEYPTGISRPTSTASIPGIPAGDWSSPGQRGWQWHGTEDVAGHSVDLSIVDWPVWGLAPPPAPPAPPPAPSAVKLTAGTLYETPSGDQFTFTET